MTALLPETTRLEVAAEGARFVVHRAAPGRRRRTTPVLLLHGVPQTAAMWRDLIPELRRDRIVLAPDLKGMGESEVAGPYDVDTLVGELAALTLHEVDGPVDVVGHDWGGVLALALAGARPDLVRRLVVVNAPYRRIDPLRAFHVPFFALPGLPELAFRLGGREAIGRMIRYAWRSDPPPAPDALEEYARAYRDPARVAAMLGYYRAAARPRIAVWRRTSRPPPVRAGRSLVVWGALDPVLPLRLGEGVVRDLGANATMLSVPAAGHFVVEEAPGVVVPAIAEFLRSE